MRRPLSLLVAVVVLVSVSSPVVAQPSGDVRVIARKLADGRIELGIQQDDGIEHLPKYRRWDYPNAPVGEWQGTSFVTITTRVGDITTKVVVRRTENGPVTVDLVTHDPDVMLWIPSDQASFDYETASVGQWLRSGPARILSQRGEPFRPPSDWFWPAGTCALGPPHDPGGPILFCTPPDASTLREYLDEFVKMVVPWYPWIGAALKWSGGYILTANETDCSPGAAGCYWPGSRTIYLIADQLAGRPRLFAGEVLVHELAHAFDGSMGWPSSDWLQYPAGLRAELFADALASNTIGEDAVSPYYRYSAYAFEAYWGRLSGSYDGDRAAFVEDIERVPDHPALLDRFASNWTVMGWCDVETCGSPRFADEVVWPSTVRSRRAAGSFNPFEGLPHVSEINVTIEYGCLDEMLALSDRYGQALRKGDLEALQEIQAEMDALSC